MGFNDNDACDCNLHNGINSMSLLRQIYHLVALD